MTQPHEQRAAEQAALFGQYRATKPINIWGARAFNVGDAVPATHVEDGIVPKDSVERVANKTEAAKAATAAKES